jgi:HlyD family secretion protein
MVRQKKRKLLFGLATAVTLGILGVWGFSVLARPETTVDPSRLATVERGDLARSVVATGRIEPITKVEISRRRTASSRS